MPFVPAPDSALSAAARRTEPSRAWRWGVALAAVVALHGGAGVWFERHRDSFTLDAAKPPVQVELLKPQRIEREPPREPAASKPAARAKAPRRPAVHAAPTERVLRATQPDARPAPDAVPAAAASGASAVAASGPTAAGPAPAAGPHAPPGVKFLVPPSGELRYNAFYNGVQNQPGTIHWTSTGDGYEMVISVPLPFVGTFTYASRGHIDAFGLAPDRYIEKRGHRPEAVTTFDRETKRIAFTRTPATLALPDGAQDRFSMVMQLASLVRGDPDAYTPGVTREFYVADDDSGETWPIETIGDDSVQTAGGFIEARHFMRLPRRDGDRRRVDVWLAPSLGWLPVRIMQSEPNGSQFELVWRGRLSVPVSAPVPGAENANSDGRMQDDPSAVPPEDFLRGAAPTLGREQP
ncbi:MAG TPA: DUF3108 domain-containing protein [Trinickia sp.]|nr:DUF3108 domain-containing protein [Trinickia sp.]